MGQRSTMIWLLSVLFLAFGSIGPPEIRAQGEGAAASAASDCAERIEQLATVPGDSLEASLGRSVQEILENVWRGYNGHPSREPSCQVDIAGKVLIGSHPHDFTLKVHQEAGVQLYRLDIAGYAILELEVETVADADRARYSLVSIDGETRKGILGPADDPP